MKGRKRHLAADTLGLVMCAVVHSAGLQDHDRQAVGQVLWRMAARGWERLRLIWADRAYEATPVLWAKAPGGWAMSIVHHRSADGFVPLPRRWVVERTFAWLGRYRRLSKGYEQHPHNSEAMIYLAMISLMLRRLRPG